ncbi:hypothetical protein I3J09_09265 [Streptomyces clavuligerus]|uniref:Septum formation initiator n=1 Tax=Streptomyces clavuligerus TaxID=1901 RepID=B5H1W3_STRCL|nr:hypothetical protein BB341_09160 [Streptomyces clavuligerus]AXU16497.1 hypothetical protein D1794_09490 [Streptomyces clavuligerus]EDY52559.1 hypothetical protein SSCG_05566 [Streptomyces clavuligerus]EFG08989.1 Hypothetical protein SCLAV_3915 [Streptomyces clavuligerus]MBY6302869.1 hypothetical protein [Streptomyces clavuligerus]
MLALLLFVAVAAIQLGVVAYTAQQAGTAARAAARTAAQEDCDPAPGREAGYEALSGWLDDADVSVQPGEDVTATVTVRVPALLPVFAFDPAERRVTMPCD